MSSTRSRTVARRPGPTPKSPAAVPHTWAEWPSKVQAFQVHAARDMLGIFNGYLGAMAQARDIQTIGEAQRRGLADWKACIEGVQMEWAELARAVPQEGLAALGWRLKAGVREQVETVAHGGQPNLVEQSTLGLEMLLRPWIGAPDLEHTDEFVA